MNDLNMQDVQAINGAKFWRGKTKDGLTLSQRVEKLRILIQSGEVKTDARAGRALGGVTGERARQMLEEALKQGLLPEISVRRRNYLRSRGKRPGVIKELRRLYGWQKGPEGAAEQKLLVCLAGPGKFRSLAGQLGITARKLYDDTILLAERYGIATPKAGLPENPSTRRYLLALIAQMKGHVREIHEDALPHNSCQRGFRAVLNEMSGMDFFKDVACHPVSFVVATAELCRAFEVPPARGCSSGPGRGKWSVALRRFVSQKLGEGVTTTQLYRAARARPVLRKYSNELRRLQKKIAPANFTIEEQAGF